MRAGLADMSARRVGGPRLQISVEPVRQIGASAGACLCEGLDLAGGRDRRHHRCDPDRGGPASVKPCGLDACPLPAGAIAVLVAASLSACSDSGSGGEGMDAAGQPGADGGGGGDGDGDLSDGAPVVPPAEGLCGWAAVAGDGVPTTTGGGEERLPSP